MSALEGLAYGFSIALTFSNLAAALVGATIGTAVGVLPGIGPIGAMALLLPVSIGMPPETALILLAGVYYGSQYGGSTTAILVNVPGEATSVVTAIDGYQMARKGRAGAALAVAAVGSLVGGGLAVCALMFFAPRLADVALRFGPPEFFALAFLALVVLSRIGTGSFWKSLTILGFGLALGAAGMEPMTGIVRFDFGLRDVGGGIGIVPVAMGLFGLAEVFLILEKRGGLPRITRVRLSEIFPSAEEWRRSVAPILRASGLGILLGIIPGPSALVSTFAAYKMERHLSRRPEEFGQGAIEGVAGPETANNAAATAQMVPLMALGIPFAPPAALLLAALTVNGVQPGPLLISQRPDVFWGVIASMFIGNVALLVINLPLVGLWVSLLRVPQAMLLAAIVVFTLIGTFSVNNSRFDLFVLVAMGALGYVLRKLDFDVAPMILAIILGPMLEQSLVQSLALGRGDPLIFFRRPLSGILVVTTIVVVAGPTLSALFRRRPPRADAASPDRRSPEGERT